MQTNVVFLILPSGTRGTKVVKVTMGRSKMVACYRGSDTELNRARCLAWLERCAVNEAQSDNAREAARAALRQAGRAAEALLEDAQRTPSTAMAAFCQMTGIARESREFDIFNAGAESDDRMPCKVCGKPVDEDDACDEHLDVHSDCEPEFIAMRADAAVDRQIDAALLGEV